MKKWGFGVMCLTLLLVSGCSTTKEKSAGATKQEATVVFSAEMGNADLSLATDSYSFTTLNNVYEGLYRIGTDNHPQIAGASKQASVSQDGLTYKIELNKEAKWSNGDAVTAKDYVFSWQRTVDPATASSYAYMLNPVKNAAAINAGKKAKTELGIQATGQYELTITLEHPTPYFTSLLAFPTYFPQNEKVVEKYGKEYAATSEKAVYNGPFVLKDFDGPGSDTSWSIQKNKTYWDAKAVKMQKIQFDVVKTTTTALNLFESGKVDDVALSGEAAAQNKDNPAYVSQVSGMTQYLELNQGKANSPFKNENLRKALSYAIDRQNITKSILGDGSTVAKNFVPSKLAKNPTTKADFVKDAATSYPYSKTEAKAYWKKAQAELGIQTLSFNLLTSDTDASKEIGEYLQGAIEQTLPGITVTVSNVPFSVRLDRSSKGNYDVVMNNWVGDFADPINFLELYRSGSSYNRGKWENKAYDALIDKATGSDANQPAKRWQDMVEASQVMKDQMALIPLYQGGEAHLRSQTFKGIGIHSVGASYDYKTAYRSTKK